MCHGLNGVSRMAKFPNLAGQKLAYLEKQLQDFKLGRRTNDGGPMAGITEQFDMKDLNRAAKWFSALPDPPAKPENDKSLAAGRTMFEQGKPGAHVPACVTCHDLNVRTSLVAPELRAQHARYLQKQLADFRSGARGNDPDSVMRRIARALTDDEITSIALYLASRPRPERKGS